MINFALPRRRGGETAKPDGKKCEVFLPFGGIVCKINKTLLRKGTRLAAGYR